MQIFVYESLNTLFLNQYWTTWKPERGVLMLELFFTLPQHAFCTFLHVGQTACESLFLLECCDSVTHPRSTDDIQKPLLIPWAQVPNTWKICKCGMRCTYQWKSNTWGEDHDWKRNKRIGMKYPWNDLCQPFTMMSHYVQSFSCFS